MTILHMVELDSSLLLAIFWMDCLELHASDLLGASDLFGIQIIPESKLAG